MKSINPKVLRNFYLLYALVSSPTYRQLHMYDPHLTDPFLFSFFLLGVNKTAESLIKTSRIQIDEMISLLEKRKAKLEENVGTWQTKKLSEIDKKEKTTDNLLDTLSEVYFLLSFLSSLPSNRWMLVQRS